MKKRNAFTLIELLAVIVILAIIALIVTPVVSNIVSNAKIAANARSVEAHIKNIEYAIISKAFEGETTGNTDTFDNITQGNVIETAVTVPENDIVSCDAYEIEHGKIVNAYLCGKSDGSWNKLYNYSSDDGASVIEFKGTYVAAQSGDTHKGIIYIDPTNLSNVCTANDNAVTNTTIGCKKFYIYNNDDNTYKMIMDRNLGTNVKWVSEEDYLAASGTSAEYGTDGNNSKGALTINKILEERTTGWIGKPKHITVTELRTITGYTSTSSFYFGSRANTSYSNQSDEQKLRQQSFYWLFEYTTSCTSYGGRNSSGTSNGYWSSTKSGTVKAWSVTRAGRVYNSTVATSNLGIRPVLEIPKSLIG